MHDIIVMCIQIRLKFEKQDPKKKKKKAPDTLRSAANFAANWFDSFNSTQNASPTKNKSLRHDLDRAVIDFVLFGMLNLSPSTSLRLANSW